MLIIGAREDDLLLLVVETSYTHQHTAWITVDAIYRLNGINLLHCENLLGAGKHRPRLLSRQK